MQKPISLIILGTGGNSIEILDTVDQINRASSAPRYECVGFLDDDESKWGHEIAGLPVLGPLSAAREFPEARFVNGIGSPRNFWRKDLILAATGLPLDRFETIVHPTASISRRSVIGRGSVILQHVTVAANAAIGDQVMVLPNAIVSHDASVGDYSCIAGGVCVSGGVQIGRLCYLGTNAAIISQVTIGDYALIGMGSVVLGDVEENAVVVGNPARFLRRTREV